MRHINVLWPPKLETEWQKLFEECTSITPDSIMEDESAFARIVEDYIDNHASKELKLWLEELKELEKQPA